MEMTRHIRSLYVRIHFNGKPVSKVLMDNRSAANVMLMSANLIYVLSSFHMLFCEFCIHIHVKLIKFPLNLIL